MFVTIKAKSEGLSYDEIICREGIYKCIGPKNSVYRVVTQKDGNHKYQTVFFNTSIGSFGTLDKPYWKSLRYTKVEEKMSVIFE